MCVIFFMLTETENICQFNPLSVARPKVVLRKKLFALRTEGPAEVQRLLSMGVGIEN